ncbi:protein roadkill-like [Cotesia glomerata]|uniref:protein roadkill-like n=1 Tax=Cotesia glomerata TaxID=32391 RepID=UPI001D024646|nr:protein roadkill-like [Cotesia glomerata]
MGLTKTREVNTRICAEEWAITNISSYLFRNNERKSSEYFILSSGSMIEDKWCLKLEFDNEDSWITVECQSGFEDGSVRATHSVYMTCDTKRLKFMGRASGEYDEKSCESVMYFLSEKTFKEILEKKQIEGDTLVLRVELQVYFDNDPFPADYPIELDQNKVPSYYQKLYFNRGKNSDVLIVVQKMGYPVHSYILKNRCPELFAKVREQPNGKKSVAAVTDISHEEIRKVLQFIYLGEIVDFEDSALGLLEVANRFKLEILKRMCEKSLSENYLTLENANDFLKFAKRCDD